MWSTGHPAEAEICDLSGLYCCLLPRDCWDVPPPPMIQIRNELRLTENGGQPKIGIWQTLPKWSFKIAMMQINSPPLTHKGCRCFLLTYILFYS